MSESTRPDVEITCVTDPAITDVSNPNHQHIVWWQGEGWYRSEIDSEYNDSDVLIGWTRWFYATPDEMRALPCQYLVTPNTVLLPPWCVSNAAAFVHVSPRNE